MKALAHILRTLAITVLAMSFSTPGVAASDDFQRYLFIGHPRDDGPDEIVQREVERIDFEAFDMLLLGGDYTWRTTRVRETMAYLDAIFDLGAPSTLAALGNHDTDNRTFFTDVKGRPPQYSTKANGIAFVVLDTNDQSHDILGEELTMLRETVAGLTDETHLILVLHHILWLADYPPLAHLKGSPLIGASSANLSGGNFFEDVYPVILNARAKGVEVICLAGDRTGTETEEFYVDHTTDEGVRLIGAGLKEELSPDLRTVVILEHDLNAGTIECRFEHLTDLPRIPDEPIVINEIQRNTHTDGFSHVSFIELLNRGNEAFDLSGGRFSFGFDFTFPEDSLIEPGEFLLLVADAFEAEVQNTPVLRIRDEILFDASNPMQLRSPIGLEIDHVRFREETTPPLPHPSDNPPSEMLIAPHLDNNDPGNWIMSSVDGGSPGFANPIEMPELSKVSREGNRLILSWNSGSREATYRLDATASLTNPSWETVIGTSGSEESTAVFEVEISEGGDRFFRLARVFQSSP